MKSIAAAVTLLLTFAAAPAPADVLLIQAIQKEPPNGPGGLPRPRGGMTMADVERRFGAPKKRLPPVGEPPISRWVYPGYTVYFERRYVINTVVHPQR